ncbi:MAG: type II secretion system secretin GspD [Smithellaceae bacterium]|nr:type II secretion system secretin GspD [Syntrophaceae bacterium]MDD4242098.1 type II secretion system secretin GspD [Smithellaceae bacterium]NLX53358.1 type II secretion system secretin GspD [Deltaproteobacteria bacterium]
MTVWLAALLLLGLATQAPAARIDDGAPAAKAQSAHETRESLPADSAALPLPPAPPRDVPPVKTAREEAPAAVKTETAVEKPPEKPSAEKSRPAPAVRKTGDRYVTLDFDNVNIEVFVKFISELTGKNFIIDDKVKGKVTILSPRKIPLSDVYKVFLSVLELNGYATVPVGDLIKIVPSAAAREKSLETRIKRDGAESEDRMVTQIIALDRANPDEVKRVLDPIIPKTSSVLSYPPAGVLIVTDYLSNIRRLLEIVKALDVEGAGEQITYLPLQNASASEVAKSLATVFQQRRPNVTPVRIVADPRTNSLIIFASVSDTENIRKLTGLMDKDVPRGESNIQVYRLQNSVAEDLAKVLNSIVKETGGAASGAAGAAARVATPVVSKNVQIVPDKATNTLVIMAEREDYKILESIIRQLDVPRPMVYIEALIMEVNTTKDFRLGVEWSGVKDTGQVNGMTGSGSAAFVSSGTGVLSGLTATLDAAGKTVLGFPSGFSMGILGAGIKIGDVLFPTIGAMVQAYKNDSDVSILSTPQILTLDNEEAEINVGSNVPYITRQESTTTSTLVNYNTYEYKDVGVILNITPHINEGNYVRLKISQQVTKVTSDVKNTTPTTLKRTAKTTVVVRDNETIVIGGLVGDSTEDGTNQVPWLGSVPILGWLFKANQVKREKTNLYVFLTPHIVRTEREAADLYQKKRESMGEVVEGIIRLNERKQESYPPAPAVPEK